MSCNMKKLARMHKNQRLVSSNKRNRVQRRLPRLPMSSCRCISSQLARVRLEAIILLARQLATSNIFTIRIECCLIKLSLEAIEYSILIKVVRKGRLTLNRTSPIISSTIKTLNKSTLFTISRLKPSHSGKIVKLSSSN